ncbi:MAG: NmrA family NAD(P)-binding protein, partial [Nitrospinae bacterium]|nr:NmrA family NAD(P)-binding protein [Nitrospinota bacterium]
MARTLLDRGESVRAIVRNREHIFKWRDRGAEVVVADLNDAAALALALDGVKGAYLLSPQSLNDHRPLEKWGRQNES